MVRHRPVSNGLPFTEHDRCDEAMSHTSQSMIQINNFKCFKAQRKHINHFIWIWQAKVSGKKMRSYATSICIRKNQIVQLKVKPIKMFRLAVLDRISLQWHCSIESNMIRTTTKQTEWKMKRYVCESMKSKVKGEKKVESLLDLIEVQLSIKLWMNEQNARTRMSRNLFF